MELETLWRNASLGGKPHVGKLFAFGVSNTTNRAAPFQNQTVYSTVYKAEVKETFIAYAKGVDPYGLFWGGYAVHLLN